MEVQVNGRKLKVVWMYNSSFLPEAAKHILYDQKLYEEIDEVCLKNQILKMNEKSPGLFDRANLPLGHIEADRTFCSMYEDGKLIARVSISRHYKDTENREKARKYSLAKLAKSVFPEDKEARTALWNGYFGRFKTASPEVVEATPLAVQLPVS